MVAQALLMIYCACKAIGCSINSVFVALLPGLLMALLVWAYLDWSTTYILAHLSPAIRFGSNLLITIVLYIAVLIGLGEKMLGSDFKWLRTLFFDVVVRKLRFASKMDSR